METKQGVFNKVENFLRDFCDKNPDYSYKVNKINVLIYHVSEKSAIIDIYGRIRNQEIRVNISDKSPEYQVYITDLQDDVDLSRNKSDSKGKLNFSFYLSDYQIEKDLKLLLQARL